MSEENKEGENIKQTAYNTVPGEDYINVYDFNKLMGTAPNGLTIGGMTANNLLELAGLLEEIKEKDYIDAAMQGKFSAWVEKIGDKKLAHQLKHIRVKENALDLVLMRNAELHEYNKHIKSSYLYKEISLYVENFEFYSDKETCTDCEICSTVCPKEALIIEQGQRLEFDEEKCTICGVCQPFCPTGAIKRFHNRKREDNVLALGHMPVLPDPVEINGIEVKNYLVGFHEVKDDCPPECEACVPYCPIGIIQKYDKDGKILDRIKVDAQKCIHCGACKMACPYELIDIKRSKILFKGEGYSTAWSDAVEKLIGPEYLNTMHSQKARTRIKKLFKRSGLMDEIDQRPTGEKK